MKLSVAFFVAGFVFSQTSYAGRFKEHYSVVENRREMLKTAGYLRSNSDPEFWAVAETRTQIVEILKLAEELRKVVQAHPEEFILEKMEIVEPVFKPGANGVGLLFAMEGLEEELPVVRVPVLAQESEKLESGVSENCSTELDSLTSMDELEQRPEERVSEQLLRPLLDLNQRTKRLVKLVHRLKCVGKRTAFQREAFQQNQIKRLLNELEYVVQLSENIHDPLLAGHKLRHRTGVLNALLFQIGAGEEFDAADELTSVEEPASPLRNLGTPPSKPIAFPLSGRSSPGPKATSGVPLSPIPAGSPPRRRALVISRNKDGSKFVEFESVFTLSPLVSAGSSESDDE
jgi:hypothetical protein